MTDLEAHIVRLPPIVDLDSLEDLRDQILDEIGQGSLTIDASSVDRVGTNALFAILSAAASARNANTELTLRAPSAPMQSAIDRLGLTEHFVELTRG